MGSNLENQTDFATDSRVYSPPTRLGACLKQSVFLSLSFDGYC